VTIQVCTDLPRDFEGEILYIRKQRLYDKQAWLLTSSKGDVRPTGLLSGLGVVNRFDIMCEYSQIGKEVDNFLGEKKSLSTRIVGSE
jgi:hypothetical protein